MSGRVAQGIKGAQAVRWTATPCTVAGPFGLACQRQQKRKGDHAVAHVHRWEGVISSWRVAVTWVDRP